MATSYILKNTAKSSTITLPPNTINGPGHVQAAMDIILHGPTAKVWGKAVDENFIRLTESFACPEDGTTGKPQSSTQLGNGFGINNPVKGQLWFNTTRNALNVFDGVKWASMAGIQQGDDEPVGTFKDGDLWFDTNYHGAGQGQLMIFSNSAWISVAGKYLKLDGSNLTANLNINGHEVIGLPNTPSVDSAATSKKYVDAQVENITVPGGYLPYILTSKSLTMTSQDGLHFNDHRYGLVTADHGGSPEHLTLNVGMTSFAKDAIDGTAFGQDHYYESNSGAVHVRFDYKNQDGSMTIITAKKNEGGANDAIAWGTAATGTVTINKDGVNLNGGGLFNIKDPVNGVDAANKQYVDSVIAGSQMVLKTGDTMTGALKIHKQGVGLTLQGNVNGVASLAQIDFQNGDGSYVGRFGDTWDGGNNMDLVAYTGDVYISSDNANTYLKGRTSVGISNTLHNSSITISDNVNVNAALRFTTTKILQMEHVQYDSQVAFAPGWNSATLNNVRLDGSGITHLTFQPRNATGTMNTNTWNFMGTVPVNFRPIGAIYTLGTAMRNDGTVDIISVVIMSNGGIYFRTGDTNALAFARDNIMLTVSYRSINA